MSHALVFGWGLSLAPHLVDWVAVGIFTAIAVILLWPMAMDRLRRWQIRRAAQQHAPPQPTAQPQASPNAHAH
jgi:hypothetical protein